MKRKGFLYFTVLILFATAQLVVPLNPAKADASYSGTFTADVQSFTYSFSGAAGDRYVVTELGGTCNAPDTWINVYDNHGNIIAYNDDSGAGGCNRNSQVAFTFGATATYTIQASTYEYQDGDCINILPCNDDDDSWGPFTLTIVGANNNSVTWFNPGDTRIAGQPGDRIAVYCNSNPNKLVIYGVEANSKGYFLASFLNSDLLAAGAKGITANAGPGNGTVSAMQDGQGDFYVAWNGGQFNATGVGPFSKSFACFK